MPIQGTAADVIKLAMVRVDERLHKEDLKAKLILQVHDELIVECPEEEKGDGRTAPHRGDGGRSAPLRSPDRRGPLGHKLAGSQMTGGNQWNS